MENKQPKNGLRIRPCGSSPKVARDLGNANGVSTERGLHILHRATDLSQIIVLSTDLLKEEVPKHLRVDGGDQESLKEVIMGIEENAMESSRLIASFVRMNFSRIEWKKSGRIMAFNGKSQNLNGRPSDAFILSYYLEGISSHDWQIVDSGGSNGGSAKMRCRNCHTMWISEIVSEHFPTRNRV